MTAATGANARAERSNEGGRKREGAQRNEMRLQRTCLPYMVVVAVVMSIYSMFLVHLTQSFRPSFGAESYPGGPDPWSNTGQAGQAAEEEQAPCSCTAESVAGLEARKEVVIGLSFPYKYFNSNHWFHISEYYVSRHAHVAPKLPRNATLYIVAPHELFVPNLIPMTFFLLLLAFTDGTATTAEVLPRRALAQLAVAGDVLVLDNDGVESYVYDSSLPAFHRTRRYLPGERRANQRPRGLAALLPGSGNGDSGGEGGARTAGAAAAVSAVAGADADDAGARGAGGGGGDAGAERQRHRHRRLLRRRGAEEAAEGSRAVETGLAFDGGDSLPGDERGSEGGVGEGARRLSSSPSKSWGSGRGNGGENGGREGGWGGKGREGHLDAEDVAAAAATTTTTTTSAAAMAVEPGEKNTAERGEGLQPEAQHRRSDGHPSHHRSSEDDEEEEVAEEVGAEFFPLPTLEAQQQRPSGRPCACARYIGEFGAAPVERGYWFREDKAENARARIDALCGDIYRRRREGQPTEPEGGEGERSSRQRLVIYQRNHDRRLLELDENMVVFRELLGPAWEVVPIVHDNAHEPCWLYSQLMDADMLLTPHGFQSMLLLFLPPGATILEVFPYKYWKEGYAPLAREWGVQHEHIMSRPVSWAKRLALFLVPLERCMKSIHCRKWSRAADVRLEEHHLRQIAKAAKQASERKEDFLPAAVVAPPQNSS